MYEDYLEEFIFKTAKLIARKLFGKSTEENNDDDEHSTAEPSQSDDLNENEKADAEVSMSDNLNANENAEDAAENNESEQGTKNDETDENGFEILEEQKPASDAVAENTEETELGECDDTNAHST